MSASVSMHIFASLMLPLAVAISTGPSLKVSDDLRVGGRARIEYKDPARAGQTIEVRIDNGMETPGLHEEVVLTLQLDASGTGSASWTVPDWFAANFNAPGVSEEHRVID